MGTFILLAAVLALTAAFSFVVAGRDTPNAVALPIAAGALTPGTALSMTAVMRVVGAIMGVGSIQFFAADFAALDRKSTRLNSSHVAISYAVFCLKKTKKSL